jgi:hypothetical protein
VAIVSLGILSVSFGAPVITIVALKPIAPEFSDIRSVPALAVSLAGAIYDYAGFYAAAFASGILFNLAHLIIVSSLVFSQPPAFVGICSGVDASDKGFIESIGPVPAIMRTDAVLHDHRKWKGGNDGSRRRQRQIYLQR